MLEDGDVYVDESGIMQMDLKIYTYDKYDMVDIAKLKIGDTVVRHSADFKGIDSADLERGEAIIYPGDFLNGAIKNYNFTPYNTTIRVEDSQIVEMNRVYIP